MPCKLLTFLILAALISGCASTRNKDEVLLSKEEVEKALSETRPPFQFRYAVYPSGNGIAMRATPRLHPNHMASVDFLQGDFPIVQVEGKASRMKMNTMLDTSSAVSWLEFGKAEEFKAIFLGLDGQTIPYRGSTYLGQAEAYVAVVTQLRFDQLFIEDVAMYVRMAKNSLGPLDRGMKEPHIDAILGYDFMRHFEYIQFDLTEKKVVMSSTDPYTPVESRLIGTAPIASNSPDLGLVVVGSIDGEEVPVVLDFAGTYFFARSDENINTTTMVGLGEVVYVDAPTILAAEADGLPRAGNMMLSKYIVTICPRAGVVYFERPPQ